MFKTTPPSVGAGASEAAATADEGVDIGETFAPAGLPSHKRYRVGTSMKKLVLPSALKHEV